MTKRTPHALVWGAAAMIVVAILRLAENAMQFMSFSRWVTLDAGMALVATGLFAIGLFQYARGSSGSRAFGAKLAGGAQVAIIVLRPVVLAAKVVATSTDSYEKIANASGYAFAMCVLATAIGMLIATNIQVGGAVAIVAAIFANPIPELHRAIGGALELSRQHEAVFWSIPMLVLAFTYLTMVLRAPCEFDPPDDPPSRALRSAASSMWLRLVAAFVLLGISLLSALSRGDGLVDVTKLVNIVMPLVDTVGMVMLAVAMSRLAHLEKLGTLAAAGALFVAGATLYRTPIVYAQLFGSGSIMVTKDSLQFNLWTVPLVGCGAVVFAMNVAAELVRDRDPALAEQMRFRTVLFGAITLGVLAALQWGLFQAHSIGAALMIMLLGVTGSVWSLTIAAKAFGDASEAVEREAPLPVAKLV
ncbi:MAG: hypothetical protein QM831_29435 [Kofleriaceae bacterium]